MSDMIMRGKYDAKVVTDFGFVPKRDDLISRAWVLAEYDRQHQGPPGGARKIMAEAPTVDAVPVVRCRDCKYGKLCFDANGQGLIQCTNPYYPASFSETWPFDLDWYCAGGKRREANETGKP